MFVTMTRCIGEAISVRCLYLQHIYVTWHVLKWYHPQHVKCIDKVIARSKHLLNSGWCVINRNAPHHHTTHIVLQPLNKFCSRVGDRLATHSLQWRHYEHGGVSNHQLHDCLLRRLFRHRSRKTPKLRVTGLCEGNSPDPGEFPAQRTSNT